MDEMSKITTHGCNQELGKVDRIVILRTSLYTAMITTAVILATAIVTVHIYKGFNQRYEARYLERLITRVHKGMHEKQVIEVLGVPSEIKFEHTVTLWFGINQGKTIKVPKKYFVYWEFPDYYAVVVFNDSDVVTYVDSGGT